MRNWWWRWRWRRRRRQRGAQPWPSPFMASSEPSPMEIDPWGRQTDPSRTRVDDDGRSGTFLGFLDWCLGFSRDGAYMGEGAESEAARVAQTTPRRGQRWARAWGMSGCPVASLRLPFGLRIPFNILRTSAFVRSRSENISYTTFLKPKTAENRNWHCGISSIG